MEHYPTGGWGASWTGDPDAGYGRDQPGGWVYGLLQFMEMGSTRSLGTSATTEFAKRAAAADAAAARLPGFNCPSRRANALYPSSWPYTMSNVVLPPMVARSDYAMNGGDVGANFISIDGQSGPATQDDAETFRRWPLLRLANGVVSARSEYAQKDVTDGTSNTYLLGEKCINVDSYEDGFSIADRGFALIGYAPDTIRMTPISLPPVRDSTSSSFSQFGSVHPSTCRFAFCDGSVRSINYDVDPEVHRSFGNRRDR